MDIEESFQGAMDRFMEFLPNLLGFLVMLLVGYVVAKIVQAVVHKGLQKLGMDQQLRDSDAGTYVDRFLPGASPSNGVARVAFWLVFVFFLFSAIGALQIPAVTTFMNQVLGYLPNVIAAIFIFVIAALISGAVAAGVTKLMGDTPTGKIVATVGPALVMVIAMFMILEQLQIAPEIVRIAFGAVMFALALGLALAFGLGGRPVAQRFLEESYVKGQRAKDQARTDLRTGRDRAAEHTDGTRTAGSHTDGTYTDGTYTDGSATQPMGTVGAQRSSTEAPEGSSTTRW